MQTKLAFIHYDLFGAMAASQTDALAAFVAQAKAAGFSAQDLITAMSTTAVPETPPVATQGPEIIENSVSTTLAAPLVATQEPEIVENTASTVLAAPLVATRGPENVIDTGTDISFSIIGGSQPSSAPGTENFEVVPVETPFSTVEAVLVVPAEAPVFSTVTSIALDEPVSEMDSRASLPKSLSYGSPIATSQVVQPDPRTSTPLLAAEPGTVMETVRSFDAKAASSASAADRPFIA